MTDIVVRRLAVLATLTASVWVLWSTWAIAAGSPLPLLGWQIGPSLFGAYLFMVAGALAAAALGARVSILVCTPLLAVFGRLPDEAEAMSGETALALERTWGRLGSLVLDVGHLRAGQIYHVASGVSEYRGSSTGGYAFEPARFVAAHAEAAPPAAAPAAAVPLVLSRQEVTDSVREVPARQQQAREVFREIRSASADRAQHHTAVGVHRRDSLLGRVRRQRHGLAQV